MAFEPHIFPPMVVTDTCAVWNILSARRLFHAAFNANLTFCITPMVVYECLHKPRKVVTPENTELINRLNAARQKGAFPLVECDIDDLLSLSRDAPIKLGSGELSCIATSYHMRTIAVMTDDRAARNYAKESLALRVETTPRLYGWLHFHRHLSDCDHAEILEEHEKHERRPLTKFFCDAYETALQYRLIEQQKSV